MQPKIPLHGRLLELYTCNCPPERPCTPELCEKYKKHFDSIGTQEVPKVIPPTSYQKIKNFSKAILKAFIHGFPTTPQPIREKRTGICKGCFRYDSVKDECRACGCKMGVSNQRKIMVKSGWAAEQCPYYDPNKPDQYWGPVQGEMLHQLIRRKLTEWCIYLYTKVCKKEKV